jgi:hypothetical protein
MSNPVERVRELVENLRRQGVDVGVMEDDELPRAADINGVEQALGVQFPEDYRVHLRTFGSIAIEPMIWETAVVERDDPLAEQAGDVYAETMSARQEHSLPEGLVVVSADPEGHDCDCLDLRTPRAGTPVVRFEFSSGTVVQELAKSFTQYVENELARHVGKGKRKAK